MIGKVYLVGAGPGDPGLLTLKGLRCLQEADFVLYDGLANPLLLRHTHAEAKRTNRARTPDGRRLDQEEINATLIEHALRGETVVRLKGGDPYVFGRGSEEAAALRAAGIPFEVVSGVTAATAAGAYAGLALTHRRHASAVAFITGHEDPTKPSSRLDYAALATFPGTLVFYMGLHRLPTICVSLVEHGLPPETPACLISHAARPSQRTVSANVSKLPDAVAAAGVTAPSLTVIGACAAAEEPIDWFTEQPLFGLRIGITRPDRQADPQIEAALRLGAEPVVLPTIEIGPPEDWSDVDDALNRLPDFDWLVFTSSNGVAFFLDRLLSSGRDARALAGLKIACIGDRTAARLEDYGLRADIVPDVFRAEALADSLLADASGKAFLWAGANRGRDVLPERLIAAGGTVTKVVCYTNSDVEAWPPAAVDRLTAGELDYLGLSSPSIAARFAELLTTHELSPSEPPFRTVAISPVTAEAAERAGLRVDLVAEEYTWDGIFEAIRCSQPNPTDD